MNKSEFRKRRRILAALTFTLCLFSFTATAFASGGDPIDTIRNLEGFIFDAIRAIGVILLGLGVVQIGMSFKSHDPSQRSNGILTFFGGVVIFFTREILSLIGVSS